MLFDHVEGSRTRVLNKDFQRLTVDRLRALLKEKKASIENTSSAFFRILKLLPIPSFFDTCDSVYS